MKAKSVATAPPTQVFFFGCCVPALRDDIRQTTHPIDDQQQHVASGNTPRPTEGALGGIAQLDRVLEME